MHANTSYIMINLGNTRIKHFVHFQECNQTNKTLIEGCDTLNNVLRYITVTAFHSGMKHIVCKPGNVAEL